MSTKLKSTSNQVLAENLGKPTAAQFKVFFAAFIHYWAKYHFFISNQNLYNLWCELNLLCHELDESFPDPYDDREAMKEFCHFHPYYFIDRISIELVANLFAEHIDDRLDIMSSFAKRLHEADIRAAYTYMNDALGLAESIDNLVLETESHIKFFR